MADEIDQLTIRFPARSGYLTVSRLNAAAMGAAAGLDIEQLDDLRLAVSEAVSWLLADQDSDGEVELVLRSEPGSVSLDATRTGNSLSPRKNGDLIETILGVTVDDYTLFHDSPTERRVTLAKRAGPADAR